MGKVFDEYQEQRRKLVEAYIQPTRITFSPEGHKKALMENLASGAFMPATNPSGQATYDGWPYTVVNDQAEDVKLHNAMTDSPHARQNAITFAMKGPFGKFGAERPKTMIEIVANSLDAKTLCDIIMTWLGADCDWGDFEKELHAVVEKHGRFE